MLYYHKWVKHLLLLIFVSGSALADQQGILWKIEGKGIAPSYLLGTIHSEDPQVLQLASTVSSQLDAARSFTAEMDLGLENAFSVAMSMMIQDGKELPELIGQSRFDKCVTVLAEYGMPEMMIRQLKPWAVMAQMSMPKPKTGEFLDRVLYERALQAQKPVYGLETYEEQVNVFDKLTLQQQIALLDEAIENYPHLDEQLRTLLGLYMQRDLRALQQYSEKLNKKSSQDLVTTFNQRLLIDRNVRMMDRMQVRLQEGNAFIAVGALHLPGEQGLLQLLAARGYRVTPVY